MTSSSTQTGTRHPKGTGPSMHGRFFFRIGLAIAGLVGLAVVAVVFGREFWLKNREQNLRPQPEYTAEVNRPTENPSTGETDRPITLSEGKERAMNLHLATVSRRSLQRTSVVPGRVDHHSLRRVELRAPAEGTVLSVSVKPSDRVKPGDVLAILQIPDIGTLRANVLQHQAKLTLALRTARWETTTYNNLESLMAALQKRPEPRAIQQRFRNRTLGKYREQVLSAYSRFILADRLTADAKPLAAKGIVSGRLMQERIGARDVTEAAYRSIRERALFNARQDRDRAQLDADNARRQLAISQRHLAIDLGYDEEPSFDEFGDKLAVVELRSPIAGTVEEWHVARTERFDESKLLFVIADTSVLIVKADIREKDWAAVTLQPKTRLTVEIPALPNLQKTATLLFVGRQVDTETRSVPLTASIDNARGLLRPGLFVRIRVPVGQPRTVLAVPTSAVMQQGQTAFVFQAAGPRSYRKVSVKTGIEDEGWTEIVSGVKPGDQVVDRAAFVLKSELLLEGEQE